jgi:tetratricopeptide (TPR) repeat protein
MTSPSIIDPDRKSTALKSAEQLKSELEGEGCNSFCISKIARLAQCYLQAGQLDSALSTYDKFAKYDCTNYKAGLCLGLLHLSRANYQKSYEVLSRVSKNIQARRDPALWLGIGTLLFKFDKNEQAEAAYQLVLSLSPSPVLKKEAFLKLGLINLRKKAYDKAITYFTNANAGSLPSPELFLFIGSCHEMKKNYGDAIGLYINAETLGAGVRALQHLGWAYSLKPDLTAADATLTRALTLAIDQKSTTSDLYYLIGRIAHTQNDLEKAEKHYAEALRLEEDNYLYLLSAAVLAAQNGNVMQAIELLRKSVAVPYRGPEAWVNMGHLYTISNQTDSALIAYTRALTIDPACAIALTRKKELDQGLPSSQLSPQLPPIRISDVPLSLQSVPKHKEGSFDQRAQGKGRGKVARREDAAPCSAPPAVNVLAHLKSHLLNPAEITRTAMIPSMMSTAATTPRMGKTEENAMFYPLMSSFISKLQDSAMPKVSDLPQKRRK